MTKDEALRLALEALENITSVSICEATHHAKKDRHLLCEECPNEVRHLKAITAIKAALEAKDEPVAWFWFDERDGGEWIHIADNQINADKFGNAKVIPLYTTPPQRKPLSEEEIGAILEDVNAYGTRLYTFARAIEAAHGIKGEA